jgi:phospho-N-acetylmuramoyl-pentapeptide-transferase
MMITDMSKVLIPAAISFFIGLIFTIPWAKFLYKHEMWKKKAKEVAFDGSGTPIFNQLHKERETKVPRLGGVVIWFSVIVTTLFITFFDKVTDIQFFNKLDFLSRDQTWIPLAVLFLGALVGFLDDYLEIKGSSSYKVGGLSLKKRLFFVGVCSFLVALWFYFKLEVNSINIPFWGELILGYWFIPFFVAVALAVYSGGIIDGLDGLAGGVFSAIFLAYAGIAFHQSQINLSAFCAVVAGAILAFLWFNIPPARYYMTETGSMALTLALTVVAFMSDKLGDGYGVSVLPIIALPLFVTSFSVIIQVLSKKFRGKKVFLVAPLHHHFEAIGWPAYKVVMRYWVISIILSVLGMIVAFIA